MSDEVVDRCKQSLQGYIDNGRHYWPGAHCFLLMGIEPNGDSDGSGVEVCTDCVRTVARNALREMEQRLDMTGALEICGPSFAYDIQGEDEIEFDTVCGECGVKIAGFRGASE